MNKQECDSALVDPRWIEECEEELYIICIRIQKVWTLVDLPDGKRAIGTKWVFRNKKDKRGIVVRNKARLVAQDGCKECLLIVVLLKRQLLRALGMWTLSTLPFRKGDLEEPPYNDIVHQEVKSDDAQEIPDEFYGVAHLLLRSMIGSLMYLTASMPDITFAVCACARDSPFDLEAFSDSDYAGASLDRKSTTGAEYVATTNCCGQVLWIQNQMLDYGFNFMNTKIYIDNKSTICIVKNPKFHAKTKHIEIRHHFIRDSYDKKLIQVIKAKHIEHLVLDAKPCNGYLRKGQNRSQNDNRAL
ncbi:putative ribonuclease H-like domain-containing protein [Tanacetum coccineum]|uniref:Ribonuclease H-like domain-containing protein n=1 Tax=Tanacetum coccineum TaxID=301880 RepID=A0ABQ5FKG9_9ASTR